MKPQQSQQKLHYISNNRYKLIKKLKSGGFGSVFIALDQENSTLNKGKYVAIKIMSQKDKKYADMQYEMYKLFQINKYTHGFIKHYNYGLQDKKCFLAMQLLDKDLQQILLKSPQKRFTLKTTLMIGLQMIDRLQALHKIGYIHRDIKPDNMVIGFEQKNKVIYLIDFGLAKRPQEKRTEEKGKLMGSLAYMSCRTHQSKQVGPGDDIESLIYSMMFLVSGGLPWMNIKIMSIADAHKILIMKKNVGEKDFKNEVPPKGLFEILNEVRALNYNSKIDYLKIKYKMIDMLRKIKEQNDFCFDWSKNKTVSPDKAKKRITISPQKIREQKMKQENQKIVQKQIYEVYKYLDNNDTTDNNKPTQKNIKVNPQSKQHIDTKKPQQSNPNNKNQNPQKTQPNNNKNPPLHQNNRPSSSTKKNTKIPNQISNKNTLMQKIALLGQIKYSGPNITINKTAKHKV